MNWRFFRMGRLNKDRLLSRLGMTFCERTYAFSSKEPVLANLSSCPPSVKPIADLAVALKSCIGCVIGLTMMRGCNSAVA